MIKTVGALVAGLMLLSSNIAFSDGNELLSKCNAVVNIMDKTSQNEDYWDMGFCLGMMQGMTNLNKLYEVQLGKMSLFCTPKSGINNGQAARIVVKYLKEHPEMLHENESFLVIRAFSEAYPCK